MCRRITCSICGKPSFAGCGLHIESVLGDVTPAERCPGHDAPSATPGGRVPVLKRLFDLMGGAAPRLMGGVAPSATKGREKGRAK
jgi:hypothetical protein